MLRITCIPSESSPGTVKVEGRLAGRWVEELARVAAAALDIAPRIVLDMAEVTFVDQNGIVLLRALRDRGVKLADCSRFVLTLLNGGVE